MKNSSVLSRRAQFAFGFAFLVFLIVGTVSQRAIFLSGKSDRWVRHSYEVIGNLDKLAAATQSIEAGYRGFVLTGGKSQLQSYRAGIENAVHAERTIRDLTVDNPLQQSRLPALEQLIADTIQFDDTVVELRRKKALEAAANAARTEVGQHHVDKIQDLLLATMGVNISAMEFRAETFLGGVFAILKDTGLDPQFLELELTESVLMKHAESTEVILKALRARGVRLAVDDFGTGYSSLSYLRKFAIDSLKIDQSFVHQISATPRETSIVTAIISMGRSLNLRVVAEGVETKEELAFLQTHHCDEAQGYYFGKAVPAVQFAKLLQRGIARAMSS